MKMENSPRTEKAIRKLLEIQEKMDKIEHESDMNRRLYETECKDHDFMRKTLDRVIRERDRLADIVKQFIYILDITEESDSGRLFHPTNITSCRAGDLQKAGELVEALRRAVKGGIDE